MALNASLSRFQNELSAATTRNIASSRPTSTGPARTSTPKSFDTAKRTHETAFAPPSSTPASATTAPHTGAELLTQVWNSVKYLKEKSPNIVPFEQLIGYLSLPNDAAGNIPLIKRALRGHERATYLPKSASGTGKEAFKYRPTHPVTNSEELTTYLAQQPTAQGISVKDLKDGWPDCAPYLDTLEREGKILVTRNKKDNSPRMVWADSPSYHITTTTGPNSVPQQADADFMDIWSKTRLPGSEQELRSELEKAGLTPTSQVKEVKTLGGGKRKEKRRVNRRGGKTTNSHMLGILKDYTKR